MLKSDITPEIKNKVKETYKELSSIRKTRDLVNSLLSTDLDYHNVRWIVSELEIKIDDVKNNLSDLNEAIEESQKYEVTDDHYIFYTKVKNDLWEIETKKYPIEIKVVDDIFKDYSKHWHNLSWEEILQKYEIKPEVFNLIKSRLRLYKASHVLSPATIERCTEEELQARINGAIDSHIHDRYRTKFINTFEKKKNEDYIKKSKVISNIDYLLDHIKEFLKEYKPRELNILREDIKNNDEITVFFSDLHLGKMNSGSVIARLNKMTLELINRPEKILNLFSMWDLFETIARWGMHPWQLESMDWPFEFDLLMKVVHTLEDMLLSLHKSGKIINFYWLGGNHDRFTAWHDDWQKGIWALIVYEMVSRGLSNLNLNINILREEWSAIDLQGFRYLVAHWDNGANKKADNRPADILWQKGKQWVPNLIVTWDWHKKQETDPFYNSTRLLVPAMAWANEYDTKLMLSSYPWYLIVTKDLIDSTPCTFTRRFNDK